MDDRFKKAPRTPFEDWLQDQVGDKPGVSFGRIRSWAHMVRVLYASNVCTKQELVGLFTEVEGKLLSDDQSDPDVIQELHRVRQAIEEANNLPDDET
ncbi:MAG: hypothetical protein ACYSWU_10465 [Planctomycetota bacterium]|jgi:hypothetical protein